jgi:hypothetical protein
VFLPLLEALLIFCQALFIRAIDQQIPQTVGKSVAAFAW